MVLLILQSLVKGSQYRNDIQSHSRVSDDENKSADVTNRQLFKFRLKI